MRDPNRIYKFCNELAAVYDGGLYIDQYEAYKVYQCEKSYYGRRMKRVEDEFKKFLKEHDMYELFYR